MKHLKQVFGAAGLLLVASASAALADYPERAITIIVPFSAGGNTDLIARIAAEHLSQELGQPVVIENRGGGGGSIGAALVAEASPDGYRLLFGTTGTHSVNPNLRDVGYDPVADFTPISAAVISSVLIAVHPSVQAENLQELMALTASDVGANLNYSSGGVGTVAHVAAELYNERTGSQLLHIPYGGAGEALNDLVSGRVHVNMNNMPSFLPHIESNSLRPIALAAEARSALLPDVPTTAEAGLEDFILGSWFGLLGPAGLPEDVVNVLSEAMSTLDQSEDVIARYAAIGAEPTPASDPATFATYMADQYAWWGEILANPVFQE